ncbi:MAG: branched-chain amino acid ABC transporter permease [Bacillota bacterium]
MGSVYSLAALGFVLIYKSSRVINFAHGDFVALGAFIVLWYATAAGLPLAAALIAAGATFFLLGLAIERAVLRPLIGKPIISVIMVTVGLSSILKGLMYLVWGPGYFRFPALIEDVPISVGDLIYLSPVQLLAVGLSAAFLVAFSLFFRRSQTGISMRAVADDQQAALALGVSVRRVFALAWGVALASAVASGYVVGNLTNLSTDGVSAIGLLVFPAAIVGGLDSIPGAILGGMLIGILENLTAGYLDPLIGVSLRQVVPFLVLVAIIMARPYGLFGTVEIERV